MNQQLRDLRQEQGQAMIQVIVSLFVIIGFIALAVDFGRVYGERRNLQNAADAAALAGARELCQGNAWSVAQNKAYQVLINNGVPAGNIDIAKDITPEGTPPYIVNVNARHPNMDAIIGQLVSWTNVNVGASAAAACGAATSGCGLWPVALSSAAWQQLTGGSNTCVSRPIVIWNDNSDTPLCPPTGTQSADVCDCYKCPTDSSGKAKFVLVASAGRAWLDFSSVADPQSPYQDQCLQSGNGAQELKCQISRNSGMKINVKGCIVGDTGNKTGVDTEVDARAGSIVRIPLYDSMSCASGPKPTFKISSFACVKTGKFTTFDKSGLSTSDILPQDKYAGVLKKIGKSSKIILATMDCSNSCMTTCGTTDGSNAGSGLLRAVSLIK